MRFDTKIFLTVTIAALFYMSGPIPENGAFWGSSAAEAATVSRIVVQGNTRVEAETVESYMTIQPGRSFSAADVDESLKTLFATGLFTDVKIAQRGGALVVTVTENPLIGQISFEGNKRIKDKALVDVIQSKERAVLTQARVQSDVQRILEAYRRTGRYRASVEPKTIQRDNNRVDLVFEINEGTKTGVERITFIGNSEYSDGRLRDVIKTREAGLLSWLRSSDVYDPDRLNADQESLRRFYFRQGYADFRVVSAVADLDREQNVFFVTFTIDEGERYTFGEVDIDTSLASVDPESLRGVLRTRSGARYNSLEVEKSLEDLTVEIARSGYAFAEVRPRADRDYEERKINLTYFIEEGPRVYIERINVRGNDRTREYVIRRELDLSEGDAYNRVLLDQAKRRLRNLSFFKSVRTSTERGSAPDRVVVNIDVEEQPTGEVSFGVGYSTSEGFLGDVSITEKNFLGRGQFVKLAAGLGESSTTYEFAFKEPYFMGRRISFGFDVYQRELTDNDFRSYDEKSTGGGVNFGLPLKDDELTLNLFYKINDREISNVDSDASVALQDSTGTTLTSILGYSLVHNSLDNFQLPREGTFAKFQQDFAGVGGDAQYIRTTAEARTYSQLVSDWDLIGMLGVKGGNIFSWGERLKVQDQFFVGGETIRGFDSQGIGPRDANTGDAIGGKYFFAATAESNFPLPFIPQGFGLRGAVFADAGSLWDFDSEIEQDIPGLNVESNDFNLRASVGVGIAWQSPFGPIRADFAYPLLEDDADKTEIFRLSGGTRF
ncbi:MAG: outer membrane protein assembly factor BamA [Stappiaceae bacterium]